jgi:uncharacterized Zn finger protein (UPF0148 family)
MRFLDNLSKTLSSGVDRAKYEADKFQRTARLNSEISNYKAQIETNMRQLGERALELYQQGVLQAPEIASLAQIIAQLRDQQQTKEQELTQASAETFEQFQAANPQPNTSASSEQNVPISREGQQSGFPMPESSGSSAIPSMSTDLSGTGLPNPSSVGGLEAAGTTPYACSSCGYALQEGSVFCPNCGTRVAAS